MRSHREFGEWTSRRARPGYLTPIEGRDLVMDCFLEAQHETFARMKERMGTAVDEASIQSSVRGALRTAFDKADADYENPSKEDLARVIDVLASRAKSWGTPEDIIEKHHEEIETILSRVRDRLS